MTNNVSRHPAGDFQGGFLNMHKSQLGIMKPQVLVGEKFSQKYLKFHHLDEDVETARIGKKHKIKCFKKSVHTKKI